MPPAAAAFLQCVKEATALVGEEAPAEDASNLARSMHRANILRARLDHLMKLIEHGMVGIAAAVHKAPQSVLAETQELVERLFACSEMTRIATGRPGDPTPYSAAALAESAQVSRECLRCGRGDGSMRR